MSQAALDVGVFSGVELRYHRLNAAGPVDPNIFLSQYEHLPTLLADLGIVIYRQTEDEEGRRKRWLVVAELNDLVKTWRPDRTRNYDALDHDATLLLAVARIRSPELPSLMSGALVLTVDRLLQRFDRRLAWVARTSPSVVLPAQLLQLMRPFVPATEDFDKRFAEAFAIPEFRVLAHDYGSTSSKVASYLATYGELRRETAVKLLRDEILLETVRNVPEDSDEFRAAVETALASANRELLATNESLARDLERQRDALQQQTLRLDAILETADTAPTYGQAPAILPGAQPGAADQSGGASRSKTIDTRISAFAIAIVLAALCVGVFTVAESLRSTWKSPGIFERTTLAALGGLGAFATVMLVIVAWRSVFLGRPDIITGTLSHRAVLGVLVLAAGAVLSTVWGFQPG